MVVCLSAFIEYACRPLAASQVGGRNLVDFWLNDLSVFICNFDPRGGLHFVIHRIIIDIISKRKNTHSTKEEPLHG